MRKSLLVMNATPNTDKLPICIKVAVSGPYNNQRSCFLHPQTGKGWNPPHVGGLFRISLSGKSIDPVGGVHRAKYGDDYIYFRNPHTGRCGNAAPVNVNNLPEGVFFVPIEESGDVPCGWLPDSGMDYGITTIPESYWKSSPEVSSVDVLIAAIHATEGNGDYVAGAFGVDGFKGKIIRHNAGLSHGDESAR